MKRMILLFLVFASLITPVVAQTTGERVKTGFSPDRINWSQGEQALINPRNALVQVEFSGRPQWVVLSAGEPVTGYYFSTVTGKLVQRTWTSPHSGRVYPYWTVEMTLEKDPCAVEFNIFRLSRVMRCGNKVYGSIYIIRRLEIKVETKVETCEKVKIIEKKVPVEKVVVKEVPVICEKIVVKEVPKYIDRVAERIVEKIIEKQVVMHELIVVQAPMVYPTSSLPSPLIQTFPRNGSFYLSAARPNQFSFSANLASLSGSDAFSQSTSDLGPISFADMVQLYNDIKNANEANAGSLAINNTPIGVNTGQGGAAYAGGQASGSVPQNVGPTNQTTGGG